MCTAALSRHLSLDPSLPSCLPVRQKRESISERYVFTPLHVAAFCFFLKLTHISDISSQRQGAVTGGCGQRVPSGARTDPHIIECRSPARSGLPELFNPPVRRYRSSSSSLHLFTLLALCLLACVSVCLSVSRPSVCLCALLLSTL